MGSEGVRLERVGGTDSRPLARVFLALLLVVSLVHLASQLVAPGRMLGEATQVLLMPMLGGFILASTAAPRSRTVTLALAAVFFSWLGDSLPRVIDGDPGFLTMVGCFMVAQVFYILLLRRWWRGSVLRRPLGLVPYLLVLAALVVLCGPSAGALLVPVVLYGLALVAMAVLSTGTGLRGGLGGAVFLFSDALIALRSFTDIHIPAQDFWIMLTYILGQFLLVSAILDKDNAAPTAARPQAAGP
ncbi:lysoplasmalogenase family protein [Glutamicibacter protophormiae]|uniref:lysoplasmalogenase family protein n=1 Tax=Glutamicibacter protophormiae TaxID=37930 RepID=UPI003A94F55D